jgi:hypothetical protein
VTVSGITTATAVSTGYSHSCARLNDGQLRCWGANSDGQLGDGNTGDSSVPLEVIHTVFATAVAAGGAHSCALRADGAARCWGSNGLSQLGEVVPAPAAVLGWTSSNPAVATIDDSGHAAAVAAGSSTIAANYGGRSISTLLTVPADADGDGVADNVDNCTLVANPGQCDSDGDDFGNHCDGDLNNNGFTNAFDTPLFRAQLGQPSVGPTYNQADLNCNGFVNAFDTPLFRSLLGKEPGPSGLVP